jgi:hypothetical protein
LQWCLVENTQRVFVRLMPLNPERTLVRLFDHLAARRNSTVEKGLLS